MIKTPEILQLQARLTVGKLQMLSAAGEIFNHVDEGGAMWSGDGDRRVEIPIVFLAPFALSPQVNIGLTGLDASHDQNLRIQLLAQDVTPLGFTLVCTTWGDTHLARVSASWQAMGPI